MEFKEIFNTVRKIKIGKGSFFSGFGSTLRGEIAIDLGTANTLILENGTIVLDEPSVIAINSYTKEVIAVGSQAKRMQGKGNSEMMIIRPLKDGVIADYYAAEQMIRHFIKGITSNTSKFLTKSYRVLICIPSGITEVEKRAVRDSALQAGAHEVLMIYEPIASAIGIGLDIEDSLGSMIVDIGGGTTEIAIISLSGIVTNQSIRVAGDMFTEDIIEYIRRKHNILIGEQTGENLKIAVGSASINLDTDIIPKDFEIRGRDLVNGTPKIAMIGYADVSHAIEKSLSKIETSILKALEEAPPELASDICQTGIFLTGGGSLLRGLDTRLSLKTKVPVSVAENPLKSVVIGTGLALKNMERYKKILMT
jgi:rod shape-determining protein MreB